jgi:hypothetical protein
MKKILAILIMLVALLASCDGKKPEIRNDVASYSIYVDTIRGHEYIILNGMYFGDIIHSESCQCKKGGNDDDHHQ